MTDTLLPAELKVVQRRLRVIAILDACARAGITPTPSKTIHVLAYLTDALAPVWHLPIMDEQLLKLHDRPFFPALQQDIDALVGCGVIEVHAFDYDFDESLESGWRLKADYLLNGSIAKRILDRAEEFEGQRRGVAFVREVVFAASGLGEQGLDNIGNLDAAYSNQLIHLGSVIDLSPEGDRQNASAAVARRFQGLTTSADLSEAELVHLYLRHLYTRMNVA